MSAFPVAVFPKGPSLSPGSSSSSSSSSGGVVSGSGSGGPTVLRRADSLPPVLFSGEESDFNSEEGGPILVDGAVELSAGARPFVPKTFSPNFPVSSNNNSSNNGGDGFGHVGGFLQPAGGIGFIGGANWGGQTTDVFDSISGTLSLLPQTSVVFPGLTIAIAVLLLFVIMFALI